MQTNWEKFLTQRNNAKKRNIDWQLTFDEWLNWWQQTGHFADRGRGKGKWVMSRFGDTGPYSLSNIFCNRHGYNISEGNNGRAKSSSHKKKLQQNLNRIRVKKPVKTPDGTFESSYEAGRHYGVTGEAVMWRIKQEQGQYKDWCHANN